MPPDAPDRPASLQDQLNRASDGETLNLDGPRERQGAARVPHAVTVEGNGCTVWARTGPVVHVVAAGVTLRNLRIECTADPTEAALRIDHADVTLDQVTVRGAVVGLKAEEGVWAYPQQLNLGTIAPNATHTVRVRVAVPVPCRLTSEVAGVSVTPRNLTPGRHEVQVQIDPLRADTLVCGTLTIRTAFLRREIVLNAHALAPATGLAEPAGSGRIAWQPAAWGEAAQPPAPAPAAPPAAPTASALPASPPLAPRGFRSISGQLLGGAFTSPPAAAAPSEAAPPETAPESPTPTAPKKPRPAAGIPSWAKSPPAADPPP